jgi:hypothetical protein
MPLRPTRSVNSSSSRAYAISIRLMGAVSSVAPESVPEYVSNTYGDWVIDHAFLVLRVQMVVGEFPSSVPTVHKSGIFVTR